MSRPQAAIEAAIEAITKKLANEGKLIEVGWMLMRRQVIPPTASQEQIDDMRFAFMAGAQHLFASILTMLESGAEPTDADLKRFDLIHEELEAFRQEISLRAKRVEGHA
jgi:hypothetical protein